MILIFDNLRGWPEKNPRDIIEGHRTSYKGQIANRIFQTGLWSPELGFFPIATISLLSLKRISDSDFKNN